MTEPTDTTAPATRSVRIVVECTLPTDGHRLGALLDYIASRFLPSDGVVNVESRDPWSSDPWGSQ